MISKKTLLTIEYDKITDMVKEFAVLNRTKSNIANFSPISDLAYAKKMLEETRECYDLLYKHSVGGIFYFDEIIEELKRVEIGGVLNNAELLKVADNLKSARLLRTSISSVNDDNILLIREVALRLYVNLDFEKEITSKIISVDEIADTASEKLYSIRKAIRDINAKIRRQLNSYMRGSLGKYLQESVVTMRQDRYVVPVKSEYRSQVKGFIHDQSSSGSTVFIEPEIVMELNNELKKTLLDEKEEIFKILADLTLKVFSIIDSLRYNIENISFIDFCYARASFSFYNKCSMPILNDKGIVDIKRGRHPLINKEKVVPVSLSLGKDYNFLLITGPNTGGKTVTLKMLGLFSVMAMSGLYIPAEDESKISVFNGVYCDIGDEQSIEQDLSTFSSHIKNIISIIDNIDNKSLILLDELGAGTDPDEGCALALAIIKKFLDANCRGIITTHYSKLKEYAMEDSRIKNASMEFDSKTLKPLYKINIGIPGSSNAIDIAKTLGLSEDIITEAYSLLSDDKITFEKVLKSAEDSKRESDKIILQLNSTLSEKEIELAKIKEDREKISLEKERIYLNAKNEIKRIVGDRVSEAEEIISELKDILKRTNLESKELFRASELKNKLSNSKYLENEVLQPSELILAKKKDLVIGKIVYIKSLGTKAKILSVKENKKEAEVLIGNIKTKVKLNDIYNPENENKQTSKPKTTLNKQVSSTAETRINVIGKNAYEAICEVEEFIDKSIMFGVEEITIIHGIGEGILLKAIREMLKKDKRVLEFRRGKYGEGENGVTIVKLK